MLKNETVYKISVLRKIFVLNKMLKYKKIFFFR